MAVNKKISLHWPKLIKLLVFALLNFFFHNSFYHTVLVSSTRTEKAKCGTSPSGGDDPFQILYQKPPTIRATRISSTGEVLDMIVPAIIAPRILGGVTAPVGTIPWQVAIQTSVVPGAPAGSFFGFCSGSILSPTWIITAGHCCVEAKERGTYTNVTDIHVLVGNPDNGSGLSTPLAQRVQAKNFFAHPDYSISGANVDGSLGNGAVVFDLALIELSKPLQFNKQVLPICMSRSGAKPFAREVGVISGFGSQTPDSSDNTDVFSLKWAHVPMVGDTDPRCFGNNTNPQDGLVTSASVMTTVVCAGGNVGTDTCPGDSGGPLVFIDRKSKQHYLVGATSYGVGDDGNACGGHYAGRYANIAILQSWVKTFVKDIQWIK